MDLTTQYCGLTLKNPFMPGASPLPHRMDAVRQLEDAGASAIVMWSLFEEQIVHDQVRTHRAQAIPAESFAEALTYMPEVYDFDQGPEEYLDALRLIKAAVDVPVIGSLNGSSPGGWVQYAKLIEEAGADALELNTYEVTFGAGTDTAAIEDRLVQLVQRVTAATKLPVAVKLLPFFAGLPALCGRLREAGASGVVLFNRTYEPQIDPELLEMTGAYPLSDPGELPLRLRWLGLVSPTRTIDLACSGGVHTFPDAVRALMCGATVVQLVSVLLQQGPAHLGVIARGVERWIEQHEYTSLDELRGNMNHSRCPDPWAYTRSNYIRTLHNYAV